MKQLIGKTFHGEWLKLYQRHIDPRKGDATAAAMGGRALKNRALAMLVKSGDTAALDLLEKHFYQAATMAEEATGLGLYCQKGGAAGEAALAHFYKKWKHEPLVMLRWFGGQASFIHEGILTRLITLEKDPAFRAHVPNDLRGLYQNFAKGNLVSFHAADGSGYDFLVERIARIDKFNPQVASRLTGSFALMQKVDEGRKQKMKAALKRLVEGQPSKDVFEVASRYLGQA
jgi:aminopeptidase N